VSPHVERVEVVQLKRQVLEQVHVLEFREEIPTESSEVELESPQVRNSVHHLTSKSPQVRNVTQKHAKVSNIMY